MEEMLTVTEIAKLLGVSRQTIYNRIENGTAPEHIRAGGRYLFTKPKQEG